MEPKTKGLRGREKYIGANARQVDGADMARLIQRVPSLLP